MHQEKQPKHEFDNLLGVFVILLIVFMFFLALKNQTSILLVVYAFVPTIIYLIINYSLLYQLKQKRFLLWIMPILIVILFHIMASIVNTRTIAQMDMTVVSYLNLLVCYVFAGATLFYIYVQAEIVKERNKVRVVEKKLEKVEKLETKLEDNMKAIDIRTTIQGIEDKCKAINFVIGRVYSNKHGGSIKVRERVRINKEWYNTFSRLIETFSDEDKREMKKSVVFILDRLEQLSKRENDVFKTEYKHFKNITHDDEGRDRILDVLIRNDKDPIETYVNSAIDFCKHVLEVLEERKPSKEQIRTLKVNTPR